MNWTFTLFRALSLTAIFVSLSLVCYAQKLLNKSVSVNVKEKPVSEVLKSVSEQGNFYFSYNSNLVPGDSLVTINMRSKSVKQILDQVLSGLYLYKETGDYIIIQRAPKEKYFYLTGQILDQETEEEVDYASIYSKQQLLSALSDDQGFFRLRLRDRNFPLTLTISKIGYADTSWVIQSDQETNLKITVLQKAIDLDPVFVKYSEGGGSWLARHFVSSKLRLQSRNIGKFFVSLPYQASFTPGLSTHGRMSTQVSNKFSINIIGGYTAGVKGVEMAGLFNISKKDVRYFQAAGMFNVVAGHVQGAQLAGLYNQVLDSLTGVQISGMGNQINKSLQGVQIAGLYNSVSNESRGIQISGAMNIARKEMTGLQIGGLFNRVHKHMKGVQMAGAINVAGTSFSGVQIAGLGNNSQDSKGLQLAGLYNYSKNLKGVQVGLINIADSSSGYSIGLINITKKGKGAFSLYANELLPLNFAWKSGNRKLYTIFSLGANPMTGHKAYSFGFGFGKEVALSKNLTLSAEITDQNIFLGQWQDIPVLYRLQTGLSVKLSKRLSLFAGPSFSMYTSEQNDFKKGYQSFSDKGIFRFKVNNKTQAWAGWQGGLVWNYGRY